MNTNHWKKLLTVSGLVLATISFGVLVGPQIAMFEATHAVAGEPAIDETLVAHADRLSNAFRQAATVAQPSVVTIISEKRVSARRPQRGESPSIPDELRRFFGDDAERFFQRPQPDFGDAQRGMASGIIISADGYILTNNHVVAGDPRLTVKLTDKSTHEAKLIGADPKTDLAVIKIEGVSLRAITLADSDKLRVGDWVLAIGGPFGLENTVTAGIISAKDRHGVGLADYEDFLQTDTAINPGNSGGPLVNMRGQVVGINTAIASRSGASAGVGFAIPSNMAKAIIDALIKDGKVQRGFLGVMIQDLTPELAESFHYTGRNGALVGDVTKDSPADHAGLKTGDIVTKLNGKPLDNAGQLRLMVAAAAPNSSVELDIFRDGKHRSITVKLGLLSDKAVELADGTSEFDDIGMTVRTLTPELSREFGLQQDQHGVVVTQVEPGSAAQRAGLQPKDIILSINGVNVSDASEFQKALGKADLEKGVRLQVRSEGKNRFVFLRRQR